MKSSLVLVLSLLISLLYLSCKKDPVLNPMPNQAELTGVIKDDQGGNYPGVKVMLDNGSSSITLTTDQSGQFSFDTEQTGAFEVSITPPLASTYVSSETIMVDLERDVTKRADFVIQPQARSANVIIGTIDIFGEIRNESGQIPTGPDEKLFAKNVFDPPLGSLHPIMDPDNQQLILSAWKAAQGSLLANCSGNETRVSIDLEGMIPNGTYTFWCNFLNKAKTPGESISFGADLVKIEALGSGTANVVIADGAGKINTTISHPSCILTDEVALVMVVDYHINGNTFGTAHIPDEEDANHLLFYFQ